MVQVRALLGSLGPAIPDVVYRLTSAFVHSTANSQFLLVSNPRTVSNNGVNTAPVAMDLGRLTMLTASSVYGTHLAAMRLLTHLGMDDSRWQARAQPLLVRWADAARDELARRPLVFG